MYASVGTKASAHDLAVVHTDMYAPYASGHTKPESVGRTNEGVTLSLIRNPVGHTGNVVNIPQDHQTSQ